MPQLQQIYKCQICGNIIEVIHFGGGELVCCGEPMLLMTEKREDEGLEKHVPIIEINDNTVIVKVGKESHPSENEHYIEWIEVNVDGRVYRKFLSPGSPTEAEFWIKGENIKARAYCNIHGLWMS